KVVREYPDVKGVQFYNLDEPAWLCTPNCCDRCKAVCRDSAQDAHNPWETQAKLVTLLTQAARDENPAFDFRLWGPVHYHGENCAKLLRSAQYNSLLSCWNGSDRDVFIPDVAEPSFE